MKKLKINNCSDAMMWYASKVGQIVPFVRETHDGYWSREDAGYVNIVRKNDAEIVEVDDMPTVTYESGSVFTITVPMFPSKTVDVSDEDIIRLWDLCSISDRDVIYSADIVDFSRQLINLVLERIK